MSARSFIISAQIRADAPLADPLQAAAIVTLADRLQLDLLLLGEITAAREISAFEPLIAAAWLASRAGGVALIANVSALHAEPFHVARALSALDFLTGGRCGWHPTTAGIDWQRYGSVGEVADDEIAAKAADFVAATRSLWDGWDADALIIDQASGVYLYSERVRRGNYQGRYHRVAGPLNAARPPQGHPVLLQTEIDQPAGIVAADIRIVSDVALPPADGSRRLLRCAPADLTDASIGRLVDRWSTGLIDGIHINCSDALVDLNRFASDVMPKLRNRGVAASARHGLLRDQLGLPIPGTAAASARAAAQS